MEIDKRRINGYLSDMVAEVEDIQSILEMPDDEILQDHHMVKSLKFSTIVIAESVGNILQHFLAKKERVAVRGFTDAFVRAGEYKIMPGDLLNRLIPFGQVSQYACSPVLAC